ncbi:MAG: DUF58 domain-containing protein, partial [Gemmatimonadetes bacterium]|nr:DUF58 domain-containing protein [Gemmatimonadota bacterium]
MTAPATASRTLDLLDPREAARLAGLELLAEGIVEGFLTGLHRSPRRGFSVEFAEHRMYQPGDELRYGEGTVVGRAERLCGGRSVVGTKLRAGLVVD